MVTRRPEDGRYAFVEIDVELELELEPGPPTDKVAALLAKAERDCFVGASLKPSPRFRWRVNGAALLPRAPGRLGALERRHRQAVALQLLPVVLGDFLVPGPDDRASTAVDAIGDAQALVVGDL